MAVDIQFGIQVGLSSADNDAIKRKPLRPLASTHCFSLTINTLDVVSNGRAIFGVGAGIRQLSGQHAGWINHLRDNESRTLNHSF
jgi:hypothetical protein